MSSWNWNWNYFISEETGISVVVLLEGAVVICCMDGVSSCSRIVHVYYRTPWNPPKINKGIPSIAHSSLELLLTSSFAVHLVLGNVSHFLLLANTAASSSLAPALEELPDGRTGTWTGGFELGCTLLLDTPLSVIALCLTRNSSLLCVAVFTAPRNRHFPQFSFITTGNVEFLPSGSGVGICCKGGQVALQASLNAGVWMYGEMRNNDDWEWL